MIYLLAKYTLLFLLASVLGFVLGYWWSRRNIVDVSESYEDLRKATQRTDATNWERLWNRLDALPEPTETDLSTVFERLDQVSSAVTAIPRPDSVDLGAVESRLGSLGKRLQGVETALRNLPEPAPQQEVDLRPVSDELAAIRKQIRELPKVETHEAVDLTPVAHKIDALDRRVDRIPQPEKIDIKPIDTRLRAIENEIGRLARRLARPAVTAASAKPRKPAAPKRQKRQPRVLSAALYGKKDDLKLISGVGPKLERLLNKNGVYYFWQVASWSRDDIKVIDERLDAFKGRISRDDWVSQAKQLKRSPEAARMPAE